MTKQITNQDFEIAQTKMNGMLKKVSSKGGFENLSAKETKELKHYTQIVNDYETQNYTIPYPKTLQGLLELKMFEKKMKQKEFAKLLNITDTKLSEILNKKRKPNISFIKSLHNKFAIDGNMLLEMV